MKNRKKIISLLLAGSLLMSASNTKPLCSGVYITVGILSASIATGYFIARGIYKAVGCAVKGVANGAKRCFSPETEEARKERAERKAFKKAKREAKKAERRDLKEAKRRKKMEKKEKNKLKEASVELVEPMEQELNMQEDVLVI